MPTRTQAILGRLPSTFRPAAGGSALTAVLGAGGAELQQAENALAALMAAHWVDHADRGEPLVDDLERMAALYGLAPRPEEDVEGFRVHLLRYVRTFLHGPSTVRGLLRVTAEALALDVADDDQVLPWWDAGPVTVTFRPRGDDAARAVLGVERLRVTGTDAAPATVTGRVDLPGPIPLSGATLLRIGVDDAPPATVDVSAGGAEPTLSAVVTAVNAALGNVARSVDGRLQLRSPVAGAGSRLRVDEVDGDAAPVLLGLPSRRRAGAPDSAARLIGTEVLDVRNLSWRRYLRVRLDGATTLEVDCAGADPGRTTGPEVVAALNSAAAAAGLPAVAGLDEGRLACLSPTVGAGSRVDVEPAASQDAAAVLLGSGPRLAVGAPAAPARLAGLADVGAGVDLSAGSLLELSVDGAAPVVVDVAGARPETTTAAEITAAINAVVGGIAVTDGHTVTLTSPTSGGASSIEVGEPAGDAAPAVLGLLPRSAVGNDASTATVRGSRDLSGGTSLLVSGVLAVGLDHGTPIEVDLRSAAADPSAATLEEIVAAVNAAHGAPVASADAGALRLSATRAGSGGAVEVEPLRVRDQRAFVTRAPLIGDATLPLLGVLRADAIGQDAVAAVLRGTVDLSAGVDLRRSRYLRVAVDGGAPVDVDCAGLRPAVTLPEDVVGRLNDALGSTDRPIASAPGGRLVLTSPTAGPAGSIALPATRATDALPALLGVPPTSVTGRDAMPVDLVGTVDLSDAVDLPARAAIRLTVDGQTHDVPLAGDDPVTTGPTELADAVNTVFAAPVASSSRGRLRVRSVLTGPQAEVAVDVPAGTDVTRLLLGFDAPRSYRGEPEITATVRGETVLSPPLDLLRRRFLRISVDGAAPVDADCAAGEPDPSSVDPESVAAHVDEALGMPVATLAGGRLVLASPTPGGAGTIALLPYESPDDDARALLLGSPPALVRGAAALAAEVTGEVVPSPVTDLSSGSMLRIAVDGEEPVDVDVAGPVPAVTTPEEAVIRIGAALPGIASLTADGRIALRSPTTGGTSRVEVLAPRHLEVVEYLPRPDAHGPVSVSHGARVTLTHASASSEPASFTVVAPNGAVGCGLLRPGGGGVRVLEPLAPGDTLHVSSSAGGTAARVTSAAGEVRTVPPDRVLDSAAPRLVLPGTGPVGPAGPDGELLLDDPAAPGTVLLRGRGRAVTVEVREADPAAAGGPTAEGGDPSGGVAAVLLGRLSDVPLPRALLDPGGGVLADLTPGPGVHLAELRGRVVRVRGQLHPPAGTGAPLLRVDGVAAVFDVTASASGSPPEEYRAVSVGVATDPRPLPAALEGSALLRGIPTRREPLLLPVGASDLVYVECSVARFGSTEAPAARFGSARFAGPPLSETGIFDVGRFAGPMVPVAAVFGDPSPAPPAVTLTVHWTDHAPGAVSVNLPAALPARLGARFDHSRFAAAATDQAFAGVVLEPADDPDYLPTRVGAGGVAAVTSVQEVPAGAPAALVPFRTPRRLTGGAPGVRASLHLRESTLTGGLLVTAREPGSWGNDIEVTARPAGPGRYDVGIGFAASVFECARSLALGAATVLGPGGSVAPAPVGVAQARAAGIVATVTRDGADPPADGRRP